MVLILWRSGQVALNKHHVRKHSKLVVGSATLTCCLLFLFPIAEALPQEIDDLKAGIVKIRAQEEGKARVGTGFIVQLRDDAAYIVTAAHVVEGDPHPKVAFFPKENEYFQADILGIEGGDPRGVAALLVRTTTLPKKVRAFTVSPNTNVRGGEPIRVIGFPREFGTPWFVVEGSIGGRRGSDISFSATIGEGSSGGPLLLNSKVIGIVSQLGRKVGYAVPISSARFVLEGWGLEFTEGDDPLLPKEIKEANGVTMRLVSRGEFPMGGQQQYIYLDAFYIDTNASSQAKVWQEAAKDCTARGKRLPTEAEWEKALRGKLISLAHDRPEWVADWYQPDYPKIRTSRNPTGPSVGESNEFELLQWENRIRSEAESWTESVCKVPDECKNLEPGQGCWKGSSCNSVTCCSESQRRSTYEGYVRARMSARPKTDMKKVLRRNADSREGAFSRSNEYRFRCVGEPDH